MISTFIGTSVCRRLVQRSFHTPRLLATGILHRPFNQIRLQTVGTREFIPENLNALQRAHKYIRDNPYTKFSLTICAIVLGLSITVELFKRFKKKKSPAVALYPPRVGHFTVKRQDLLEEIDRIVNLVTKQKGPDCPVLNIRGESGSGKSELVHQYVSQFINTRSSKWFGLRSVHPVVLYINGSSADLFESSLKEAAFSLGVKDRDLEMAASTRMVSSLSMAIRSKLLDGNSPWLVVVDNLRKEAYHCYTDAFHNQTNSNIGSWTGKEGGNEVKGQVSWAGLDGAVIVVTRDEFNNLSKDHVLSVPGGLSLDEGMKLFCRLSNTDSVSDEAKELVRDLKCHPLALALAASTIKIYEPFVSSASKDVPSVIAMYRDLLKQNSFARDISDVALSLYLEAAVTDERFRHTFDILGSCDLTHPLPVSVIASHLNSSFFKISKESLAPPPIDTAIQIQKLTGIDPDENSYFAQLKAMVPFTGSKGPSSSEIAAVLATSEDCVSFLRKCPLLSFKSYRSSGFEYMQIHQCSFNKLSQLFTKYTVPKLDEGGLQSERSRFDHSTWFRKYRSFDSQQALENFHRSLPGISEPGVMTSDEFGKQSHVPSLSVETGTRPIDPNELGYFEYQHLVSHYHRVIETLSDSVKAADNDESGTLLKRYLHPHIKYVSQYPLLSQTDQLLCSYSLVSIEAVLIITDYEESLKKFAGILSNQKQLYGERSQTVARTLVDMAILKYSQSLYPDAKNLLQTSLAIFEKISTKQASKNFALEIGLAYSTLAFVCSSLGEKWRSMELLEQSLGAYQTLPSDGVVSKRQRKLVSSCLTDVAHAYLSLGDVTMAKKYIDLSVMAHRNLYIDGHPETVRTLNVGSNVYSLLGDKPESRKLRDEAGKLIAQIESHPLVA